MTIPVIVGLLTLANVESSVVFRQPQILTQSVPEKQSENSTPEPADAKQGTGTEAESPARTLKVGAVLANAAKTVMSGIAILRIGLTMLQPGVCSTLLELFNA